ncbi:DUF4862 family protein [Microbacterium xylanilyticum]
MIVGAYAASPGHARWDPAAEQEFFEGLEAIPEVRGLELPWTGSVHPHDDRWLHTHFPRRFDAVLTSIPGTMTRLRDQPAFGLASEDPIGRAAAVRDALAMRDAVRRLDDACGRRAVIAVELHSAPSLGRPTGGTVDALRTSLEDLVESGGWDDAALVIEHCDAAVAGQTAEKGFLTIDEELAALEGLSSAVGMSMNWGRSAIELRNADRVATQIRQVSDSGRLRGLILSGASDLPSRYGAAWSDAHLPLAPVAGTTDSAGFPMGEPTSLLTLDLVRQAIDAAGDAVWRGFKFGWPDPAGPTAPRIAMISSAARLLAAEFAGGSQRQEAA